MPGGTEKKYENFSQDSVCPGQEFNQSPPERKTQALMFEPTDKYVTKEDVC
jgi:hypothetical protein